MTILWFSVVYFPFYHAMVLSSISRASSGYLFFSKGLASRAMILVTRKYFTPALTVALTKPYTDEMLAGSLTNPTAKNQTVIIFNRKLLTGKEPEGTSKRKVQRSQERTANRLRTGTVIEKETVMGSGQRPWRPQERNWKGNRNGKGIVKGHGTDKKV